MLPGCCPNKTPSIPSSAQWTIPGLRPRTRSSPFRRLGIVCGDGGSERCEKSFHRRCDFPECCRDVILLESFPESSPLSLFGINEGIREGLDF
jgi:hypothetical protein